MKLVSPELELDRSLALSMPKTWDAFFGTFGRLTPIQRKAIPIILDGKDCLVVSATASGKTEAATAPLVERSYLIPGDSTILYVSPTRALVNDLYERLYNPLNMLNLGLQRRTGEHKDNLKRADVILTTPESFDSMLCRGSLPKQSSHILANVTAIVIDEVHLTLGSARGEQLRWLIERLRKLRDFARSDGIIRSSGLQIIALSATVPNPQSVMEKFLAGGQIAEVSGSRKIEAVSVDADNPSTEKSLLAYVRSLESPEKILVFSNTRKRVDALARDLRGDLAKLSYEVRAHHGSLSRKEREAAENSIKKKRRIVTFATMTLELGIDIGDIDLVVLDGPANDMQSLLQRIGRGNRRTNLTRVMACSGSPLDSIINSAMLQAASDGWIGSQTDGPQYAVSRQQVASYLFQSRTKTRSKESLINFLSECGMATYADSIIDLMLDQEELVERGSGIGLGEEWLYKGDLGQIHTNIESIPGLEVVDAATGASIAEGLSFVKGPGLGVAGFSLEVKGWNERKLEVRRVADQTALMGSWGYTSRGWLRGSDPPQSLKRYLSIDNDVWPIVKTRGKCHVFHFGGTRRETVLKLSADKASQRALLDQNEWFVTIEDGFEERPQRIDQCNKTELEPLINNRVDSLENQLGRPRANRNLPDTVRIEELIRWLNLDIECEDIRESQWQEQIDREQEAIFRLIVNTLSNGNSKKRIGETHGTDDSNANL